MSTITYPNGTVRQEHIPAPRETERAMGFTIADLIDEPDVVYGDTIPRRRSFFLVAWHDRAGRLRGLGWRKAELLRNEGADDCEPNCTMCAEERLGRPTAIEPSETMWRR